MMYSEFLDSARFPAADDLERIAELAERQYKTDETRSGCYGRAGSLKAMLDNRRRIAPGACRCFSAPVMMRRRAALPFRPTSRACSAARREADTGAGADCCSHRQSGPSIVFARLAPFTEAPDATAKAQLGERYLDFDVSSSHRLDLAGFADAPERAPSVILVVVLSIFQDADGPQYVPREAAPR